MNFPTMMKWGRHSLQFVRPIRWLVSLLDDEVVPFSILDVTAGRMTRGHRFLGHDVEIKHAEDYEAELNNDFVIANQKQRKNLINLRLTISWRKTTGSSTGMRTCWKKSTTWLNGQPHLPVRLMKNIWSCLKKS